MEVHENACPMPHRRERSAEPILSAQTPEASRQVAGLCARTSGTAARKHGAGIA